MLHCQIRAGRPACGSTMFVGLPIVPASGCWPGSKSGNLILYGMPSRKVNGGVPYSGALNGLVEPKLLAFEASLFVFAYIMPPPMRKTVRGVIWYARPTRGPKAHG